IQIVKRDGSTEPFCFAKLLHCIQCGFQSSGEPYERHSANSRGLAEAVQTYLHEAEHDGPISSAHLAKLVELVLTQTGFSAAGMAIRRHAELRRRQRNWIKVAHRRDRDGHIVQKRWSRRHVVDILTESHRLGMTTARIISCRVEQVVFNCG